MSFPTSICALAVCASAGLAQASVAIVFDFDAVGTGRTENRFVQGLSILNFDSANFQTTADLTMFNLRPNTTYGVRFIDDAGAAGQANGQAFTTNWFGCGSYHTMFTGDATIDPVITIFRWNPVTNPDAIDVTPAEERAIGTLYDCD
jgi:hypothetical protein